MKPITEFLIKQGGRHVFAKLVMSKANAREIAEHAQNWTEALVEFRVSAQSTNMGAC
jgi:hypothetical protein